MDKISETLGAMTSIEPKKAIVSVEDVNTKTEDFKKQASINLQHDYEAARANLKALINQSISVIPDLVSLVREAESPRMYESAASFFKMVADLNKDLLSTSADIGTKEKGTRNDPPERRDANEGKESNTTVFIGTSDELFKSLSKRRAEAATEVEFVVTSSNEETTTESTDA